MKYAKSHELVVGEIIMIEAGMTVPVDGIVLGEPRGVQVVESVITGKSQILLRDSHEECLKRKI